MDVAAPMGAQEVFGPRKNSSRHLLDRTLTGTGELLVRDTTRRESRARWRPSRRRFCRQSPPQTKLTPPPPPAAPILREHEREHTLGPDRDLRLGVAERQAALVAPQPLVDEGPDLSLGGFLFGPPLDAQLLSLEHVQQLRATCLTRSRSALISSLPSTSMSNTARCSSLSPSRTPRRASSSRSARKRSSASKVASMVGRSFSRLYASMISWNRCW